MNIYVVRHGETQWNREEIFRGRKDIPLNDYGLIQADRAGKFLSGEDIDIIYASPLTRTVQTAKAIIKYKKGLKMVTDNALIDMDFGIWEGMSLRDVEAKFPEEFNIWKSTPHRWVIKDAERLKDIRKRINGFLKTLKGYNNVVLVTHRVICKIIIMTALGLPLNRFWKIKIDPASVSMIKKENDYIVEYVNFTGHLGTILNKDF